MKTKEEYIADIRQFKEQFASKYGIRSIGILLRLSAVSMVQKVIWTFLWTERKLILLSSLISMKHWKQYVVVKLICSVYGKTYVVYY